MDEWIDPPILTVDETDQEKLFKLCARYKDYIIKSQNAVFNCNGYIPQQKVELDSGELTETDDVYSYERDKRSDNGTDIEGSGEITDSLTEDAILPVDSENPPAAAEDEAPPAEPEAPPQEEDPSPPEALEETTSAPEEAAITAEEAAPPAEEAAPPVEEASAAAEESGTEAEAEKSLDEESSTAAAEDSVSPDETVQMPAVLSAPDSVDSDKPPAAEDTGVSGDQIPDLAGRSAAGVSGTENDKASSDGAASSPTGKFTT